MHIIILLIISAKFCFVLPFFYIMQFVRKSFYEIMIIFMKLCMKVLSFIEMCNKFTKIIIHPAT